MGVPTAGDFNKWDGSKFTNTDWDDNVDKTVEILANGNYDLNVAQITATNYVGIPSDQFSTITAGENLSAGDVLRISSGQAFKADNTTEAGVTAVVGVCNTAVTSGNTVKIDYGYYDGFSTLTAGTTYYVSTSGGITSTKPSSFVFEMGIAVSTTRINFSFNNKSLNLEVQNTAPTLTLIDTNSGASQTQSINFDSSDGNYAKIEGATTGTAEGELNLYTDAGSGMTERISVGESTKINQNLYIHDHTKYIQSTTTNVLQLQSASSGFHSWFLEVYAMSSGFTRGAMRTYSVRSYSANVNAIETEESYTPTNGMSVALVDSGSGVLTLQAANSSQATCKFLLKIYTSALINVTKL